MQTTPIRSRKEIEKMKSYFLEDKNYRDYALFVTGINTALRISDLLHLKWEDVYNTQTHAYKSHVRIIERKTNKQVIIALNTNCISALKLLKKNRPLQTEDEYIFSSNKNRHAPLSRNRAYHIIKNAATLSGKHSDTMPGKWDPLPHLLWIFITIPVLKLQNDIFQSAKMTGMIYLNL